MRILKWLGFGLVATLLALVAGTLVPRPLFGSATALDGTRRVLVVANPIHTDIVLPLDADVLGRFAGLGGEGLPVTHPDAQWLAFGWGSRAFYIETPAWADLKPGPLFKALTLDSSVMHVTVAGDIDLSSPQITSYDLDDASFAKLVEFIEASFVTAEDGRPVVVPDAGYGPDDAFFEAHGSFNALVGCNTWTARALREAGFQTGWWNPLPQLLVWSLDLHN